MGLEGCNYEEKYKKRLEAFPIRNILALWAVTVNIGYKAKNLKF